VAQGCRGIPKTVANATAVTITRPVRGGPGGDITGTPATVATYPAGLHRVRHRLFKRPDGREIEVVGELAVDGFDSAGVAAGITEGDLASFTLTSGRLVVEQEVLSVQEYAPGGRLSWVVLSLGG
jgi:hypothetical protein